MYKGTLILALALSHLVAGSGGIDYINKLRAKNAMIPLQNKDILDVASYKHLNYLKQNNLLSHDEIKGKKGFYAQTPAKRLAKVGFTFSGLEQDVNENLSIGDSNVEASIDSLFSSIYHRFNLLSFDKNLFGYSYVVSNRYRYKAVHYPTLYNYTLSVQNALSAKQNQKRNPSVVLWPALDSYVAPYAIASKVSPIACAQTGYPLSVSFNEAQSGTISLQSFKLYDKNAKEVKSTLVTQSSDKNKLLSSKEFALIPDTHLNWGEKYVGVFKYKEDGIAKTKNWVFYTQTPPYALYHVKSNQQSFNVKSGKTYLFYFEPSSCNDVLSSVEYETSATNAKIESLGFEGLNSINLKINAKLNDKITLKAGGKTVYLKIASNDSAQNSQAVNPRENSTQNRLYFRNAKTGEAMLWQMQGSSTLSKQSIEAVKDANWDIKAVGDMDGDGKEDLLWRNSKTGANVVWLMDGARVLAKKTIKASKDSTWDIKAVGDFNLDKKLDILWRNTKTGKTLVWFMDRLNYKMSFPLMQELKDTNWDIKTVADFNLDGYNDIVWRNSKTGQSVIWYMRYNQRIAYKSLDSVGAKWDIEDAGDFNSDGDVDIVWRNKSTGQNSVWYMDGLNKVSYEALPSAVGSNWNIKN